MLLIMYKGQINQIIDESFRLSQKLNHLFTTFVSSIYDLLWTLKT